MADQVETQYFGEIQVPIFGNGNNVITINVSSETPMYRYCKQNYFSLTVFPAIPSLQGSMGSNWMSSEQRQFSEVYGWFSIAIFVAIFVILSYAIGYNTATNKNKVCLSLMIICILHSCFAMTNNVYLLF